MFSRKMSAPHPELQHYKNLKKDTVTNQEDELNDTVIINEDVT